MELTKREFCALLIFSMIIVGLFTLSPAFSSFMGTVVVSNWGKILLSEVTAKSGSPEDIQATVNSMQAVGGGIVHVPAGTYNWNNETVNIPGGVNIIGAGNAGCDGHPTWTEYNAATVLHNNKAPPFNRMFYLDGSNGKPSRISGIRFEATSPPTSDDSGGGDAIDISKMLDFRVDHCTFIDFSGISVLATNTNTGNCRGVIDHCIISNPYKAVTGGQWAYGFYVQGRGYYWNDTTAPISSFLGKYDAAPANYPILYVEDSKMSYCRHTVDAIQGGWIVARFNYIDHPYPLNFGQLDEHGSGGGTYPSARGFEFYNNTVVCEGSSGGGGQCVWLRGGGGVVYDNTFKNLYVAILLSNETCPPQPDEVLHNVWIWGNTQDSGTLLNPNGFTENVEYFLRAPNQAQDGFAYTPYPYPHPLTTH